MKTISIVVPCFNEEEVLPEFYEKMKKTTEKLDGRADVELIFVDDGSDDSTLQIIEGFARNDSLAGYISLSRNFGKEAAMLAGLEASRGDFTAVMDADLQDSPDILVRMFDILEEKPEVDCVAARRVTRQGEPKMRSFFARRFYSLINRLSDVRIEEGARDFRLMRRDVVDAVLSTDEKCRFSKGIFSWVGFNTEWIEHENTERAAGDTKWSFKGLVKYAFEGIIAYSLAPLKLPYVLSALSIFASVILFVMSAFFKNTAVVLSGVILFCTFLVLLSVGVLGAYLARVYREVKPRPQYIVRRIGGAAKK